jgi:hypothetical protein
MALESEFAQNLRPTMLIGLGGSGKEVLMRIRRLFYERMGKNADGTIGYPIVGYLVLDTDPNSGTFIEDDDPGAHMMGNIQFERGGMREFIDCSVNDQDIATLLREGPPQHPQIFRWLLREVMASGTGGVASHGAGQKRQVARLCFFKHLLGSPNQPGIRPTLERWFHQLLRHAREPNLLNEWNKRKASVAENELDVVVVYSLAGGTGCGMFLDLGILVREVVRALNVQNLKAYFTHIAILPEPFLASAKRNESGAPLSEEEKKTIRENAYVALREMEYFSLRPSQGFDLSIPPPVPRQDEEARPAPWWYPVWWPGEGEREKHDIDTPPWDTCFLIGGSNDPLGTDCVPAGHVYQMIAEYIFLDFDPNQFGTRRRMRRSNQRDRILGLARDEVYTDEGPLYRRFVSRRFSTFGLSQIYFDRARMRRAAAFYLAKSLIEHWMRPSRLLPKSIQDLADRDLAKGTALAGSTTAAAPITFDAIRELILVVDRKSDARRTWHTDVEEDVRARSAEVASPGYDPLQETSVVESLLARHEERWRRDPVGGKEGIARQSMAANARAVTDEVEKRVRALLLQRVAQHGIGEVVPLLQEYDSLLQRELEAAEKWCRARPSMEREWRDRLAEARRLPNPWPLYPATRAAREELLRALAEAETYLKRAYTVQASDFILGCLAAARRRVAAKGEAGGPARESNHQSLQHFQDLCVRMREFLQARFAELSKADTSRARTVGLLDNWSEGDYLKEIRSCLEGRSAETRPYIERVEEEVLKQLREQKSRARDDIGRWEDVTSLGGLVARLFPPGKKAETVGPDEFATSLANACWELLEGFCKDRTALDLFAQGGDDKAHHLNVLRKYSSPFLRQGNKFFAADDADTTTLIQLGIDDRSENARPFTDQLKRNGTHSNYADLTNPQSFRTQHDAIVLCQEKHGLPLFYYQGLDELAKAYYTSVRQPERFLDFPFLKDSLPEIRRIDAETQRRLGISIELVLQGIAAGVLVYEPEGARSNSLHPRERGAAAPFEGGRFFLETQSGKYAPPMRRPQGTRLENLIHHYAENETDRLALERQIANWISLAKTNHGGAHLALLLCSIENLIFEVGRRVQFQLHGLGVATHESGDHPLVKILTREGTANNTPGLVPRLRTMLGGFAAGRRWLDSPVDLLFISRRPDLTAEEREEARARRAEILAPCFKRLPDENLPIEVILGDAELKLPDAPGGATDVA